jgi:hypothetical protein
MQAKIQFNETTALYECETEYGLYTQVHVSGDVGLFDGTDGECLFCAHGQAHEVAENEDHEIDGAVYVATLSGWKAPE